MPLVAQPKTTQDPQELQPNLQELAVQLRMRYPDGLYERTLHNERDRDAEQRRARAFNSLIDMLVEQVVRDGFDT